MKKVLTNNCVSGNIETDQRTAHMKEVTDMTEVGNMILVKGALIHELNNKTERHGDINHIRKGEYLSIVYDDGYEVPFGLEDDQMPFVLENIKNKPARLLVLTLKNGIGNLVGVYETDDNGKVDYVRCEL